MRVLVHGWTLGPDHHRLAMAAAGLAGRGHEVHWLGSPVPVGGSEFPIDVVSAWTLPRLQVDVVFGADRDPVRVALAGWLTRARAQVLGVAGETARGWSMAQRWCWESIESAGIASAMDRARFEERPGPLDLLRLAEWPAVTAAESADPAHPDVETLERLCERLIARRRSASMRRAAFLDRDGTLIVEKGYVHRPEDVEILPRVPEALRVLAAAGYALVVVSNQSGVGRGMFPPAAVYRTTARLRRVLRERGVEIEAFYFCPHLPDSGCRCRKPGTELLERAARDLNLSLRESAMIGDKLIDVATGHNAKALGLLVRSGYGREEEQLVGENGRPPDLVGDDLEAAARWLAARAVERAD